MEMTVKLVTRPYPYPELRVRVVVLVIVLVTVVIVWRWGCSLPDAITVGLGAGLAGAKIAQALPAAAQQKAAS